MSKECIQVKPEDISKLLYEVYDVPSGICEQIKNMVQRLEAIDNANPSEALKCLEEIRERFSDDSKGNNSWGFKISQELNTIKQALLKAEQDKKKVMALEIAIKKEINIKYFSEEIKVLGKNFTYEFYLLEYDNYHYFVKEQYKLTQEEFNLLKEVLE